jgi:hypothetical protein
MFQIAAAIGYAKEYGYQWAADPSNGHGEPYSCIHKVFPNLPKSAPSGLRFHEHPNKFCEKHGVHMDLCHFDYHEIPDMGPDVALSGFFQSYKYFENAQEEVRKVFKLNINDAYKNHTSIHVRLGDYLQHSGSFPPITSDYLHMALRSIPHAKECVIFSDDISRVKDMVVNGFEEYDFEFSEGKDELQDISLMASCGNHIIANSTFSWWAAYLGHNPNRIVVSPSAQTWFGPTAGVKQPVIDLIPSNWIQIHTR